MGKGIQLLEDTSYARLETRQFYSLDEVLSEQERNEVRRQIELHLLAALANQGYAKVEPVWIGKQPAPIDAGYHGKYLIQKTAKEIPRELWIVPMRVSPHFEVLYPDGRERKFPKPDAAYLKVRYPEQKQSAAELAEIIAEIMPKVPVPRGHSLVRVFRWFDYVGQSEHTRIRSNTMLVYDVFGVQIKE